MKTFQLVLTTLICVMLLVTSTQAQQLIMGEPTQNIAGPPMCDTPPSPDLTFMPNSNTLGITTKGDLEDFILNEMDQKHFPGLSAILLKDFKVAWSGHFGYANINTAQPVTEDTLFYIASISKTVTATALMQLWEQGKFELNDPINDYLFPFFSVVHPTYPNTDITFYMLLTHTSSIVTGLVPPRTWGADSPIPLGYFLEEHFTPGGIYYDPNNFASWEPGSQWSYSGVGIALAGYLVEVISGMELEPYCQTHIFEPLEMDNTSFFLANLDSRDIAVPYYWVGSAYQAYQHYGYVDYPACQLRTSASQLIKFLSTFMKNAQANKPPFHGGNPNNNYSGNLMSPNNSSPSFIKFNDDPPFAPRLLERITVEEMLTPYFAISSIPFASQGLAWFCFEGGTYPIWGHGGESTGASAAMWYCPEVDVGVVVLANSQANIDDIVNAIFAYSYEL